MSFKLIFKNSLQLVITYWNRLLHNIPKVLYLNVVHQTFELVGFQRFFQKTAQPNDNLFDGILFSQDERKTFLPLSTF